MKDKLLQHVDRRARVEGPTCPLDERKQREIRAANRPPHYGQALPLAAPLRHGGRWCGAGVMRPCCSAVQWHARYAPPLAPPVL
eukprot:6210226-Pleurochrysis_carterae.AAC.2